MGTGSSWDLCVLLVLSYRLFLCLWVRPIYVGILSGWVRMPAYLQGTLCATFPSHPVLWTLATLDSLVQSPTSSSRRDHWAPSGSVPVLRPGNSQGSELELVSNTVYGERTSFSPLFWIFVLFYISSISKYR